MLSEAHYWMFGNALLLVLDFEALIILGLHLWFRRSEFSFAKHGVSLAVFVYVFGHFIFRIIAWELWREVSHSHTLNDVVMEAMQLFDTPLIKFASLLTIAGLVMIMAILTYQVQTLWMYATAFAVILAAVSTILT